MKQMLTEKERAEWIDGYAYGLDQNRQQITDYHASVFSCMKRESAYKINTYRQGYLAARISKAEAGWENNRTMLQELEDYE
jgi:Ser/Thr protein kinase RdoA (MazF antagonist)